VVEAIVDAIDDGAVGEQRREAQPARFEDVISATDVQVTFVLPGEAGSR